MEWMSDGRRRRADFSVGLPAAEAARRLRTALDPEGDWMAQVLRDADARLTDLRAGPHPDAGGLVVAIDMEHAERLAERLTRISGERPTVVTSDAPDASQRIARFAAGSGRWLVSVLMVSEGVDVPRLRVGVYATTARTELFFRQVVGRFVRRTPAPREQMSHLFLASDPRLKQLAAQVEEERNHALVEEAKGEAVAEQRERAEATEAFRALWSSARRDDDVLRTTAPGDALQLFADAAPEPAAPPAALAAFTTTTTAAAPSRPAGESAHQRRERLRDERRALVAAVSRRTGEAHRVIHGRINRETGARSVTAASVEQLERGNRLLERQTAKRR
jgi:superfamily II DNA or RNA helicase